MQRQLLLFQAQGPDRPLTLEETPKLHTDVQCPRPITILNQLAFLVLANAQAANLSSVPSSHRRMRTALPHAPAARLRRVLLWGDCHHEPFGQLPHQPDADARRIALVARRTRAPGNCPPASVGEHHR